MMHLRLRTLTERIRASLFVVPMVAVVAAVAVGVGTVAVDQHVEWGGDSPAFGLASTVDSARALLSTVAGATISFAAIAFSVSLLIIQLASSQYSPRVVHTLFRDPFNKRVMALVVGTFTYCLVVLRAVRSSIEAGGDPVVPRISVALAAVLGITTILAVVAFINHSAHSMDVSEVLERVRRDAVKQIRTEWSETVDEAGVDDDDVGTVEGPSLRVRFDRSGWVQVVDTDAVLRALPAGAVGRLETFPGRYAIEGTPLCTVTPAPDDAERVERAIRSAVGIGDTRTMQQDVSYGLRQLADVALKALSPGVNDPTTAQDAIFHGAAVLGEALRRESPPRVRRGQEGRRLLVAQQPTHAELIELAYGEVRRAAAAQPQVCVYLLESIELLVEALTDSGHGDRCEQLSIEALRILDGAEEVASPVDAWVVRSAYVKRFGAPSEPRRGCRSAASARPGSLSTGSGSAAP